MLQMDSYCIVFPFHSHHAYMAIFNRLHKGQSIAFRHTCIFYVYSHFICFYFIALDDYLIKITFITVTIKQELTSYEFLIYVSVGCTSISHDVTSFKCHFTG